MKASTTSGCGKFCFSDEILQQAPSFSLTAFSPRQVLRSKCSSTGLCLPCHARRPPMGVLWRLRRVPPPQTSRRWDLAPSRYLVVNLPLLRVVSSSSFVQIMILADLLYRARSVEKLWTWPETLPRDESVKHGVDVATTTYGMLPAAFMFVSSFACIRCTPTRAQPPPPNEAILRLESTFPSLDWSKPGPGFPLSLVSPVRSETWFNQGFRSKAIVDPW